MKSFDVAIVGAGIVGAACAAALSREGLKVVIIDANGIATGTTAAGMGHIVVMDDSEAQFALTRYSRLLWDEAAPRLPRAVEFERCGTLWVVPDDCVIYAPLAARWLLESSGVELRPAAVEADVTIYAAGTWSVELVPELP